MLRDVLAFDVSDGPQVGCFQAQNWFITYGVFHEIESRGVWVQIVLCRKDADALFIDYQSPFFPGALVEST